MRGMTARKQPTAVFHFTHIDHLATVIRENLLCDAAVQGSALLSTEIGNVGIKGQRRGRSIKVGPNGTVADYVPFYFAPRSPMMYAIARGAVPTFQEGTKRLVYLVTSLERLHQLGHRIVLTDRNAALKLAEHQIFEPDDLVDDGFIDWPLMDEKFWTNTPENPDRKERRMAEALVYQRVNWEAIEEIVVHNGAIKEEATAILEECGVRLQVNVRPAWYF